MHPLFQILHPRAIQFEILHYVILIAQPWRFMIPDKEFFEAANHGIALDHFFKYGSIPFIENFDAHMLNQQFFSYIYVFFNGYEPWSHSLYILYFYVLESIVLYFVFKKIASERRIWSSKYIFCLLNFFQRNSGLRNGNFFFQVLQFRC